KTIDGITNAYKERLGTNVGFIVEWETPIVGLCLDAAPAYTHKSMEMKGVDETFNRRDLITIPVNLKYKFRIRGVENAFKPFIFTGPQFAFLISDKNEESVIDKLKNNTLFSSTTTSWNIGAGVELFNHLQISAAYCMGLNKSIKEAYSDVTSGEKLHDQVEGTDRCWTISAALFF
ncbi:MAG: PorT family protein, partial [Muribaculaceae bacterium]|nr:PorT family protein [Muribaculaceae bacterium]